jgi:hypothetical protein
MSNNIAHLMAFLPGGVMQESMHAASVARMNESMHAYKEVWKQVYCHAMHKHECK